MMTEIELSSAQGLVLTLLVYFLGRCLRERVSFLKRFLIPEAVVGGLLAAVGFAVLRRGFGISVVFPVSDLMMLTFFTTIGLHARLSELRAGGKALLITLGACVMVVVVENLVGMGFAMMFGASPAGGLMAGSVALIGGHGTAAAWSPIFEKTFDGAGTLGLASATFGLIAGGIVGAPMGRWLIQRYHLRPDLNVENSENLTLTEAEMERSEVQVPQFFACILMISCAIALGEPLRLLVAKTGLMLPHYVTSLVSGIFLSNLGPVLFPKASWPQRGPAMRLISGISLNIFLVRALMMLDLLALAPVAGKLLLVLGTQVVILLVMGFLLFLMLRKTYDAAIIVSGFLGLSLGATPTAVANMSALTEERGPSRTAFLVIPLVGAFFIDLVNGFVISGLYNVFVP